MNHYYIRPFAGYLFINSKHKTLHVTKLEIGIVIPIQYHLRLPVYIHPTTYTMFSTKAHINGTKKIKTASQRTRRQMKCALSLFCGPKSLLRLPTEIILMIASHLDVVSSTTLALTSRRLYTICFPGKQAIGTSNREKLLLLLERDLPSYHFCHLCVRLHDWRRAWNGPLHSHSLRRLRHPWRQKWMDLAYPNEILGLCESNSEVELNTLPVVYPFARLIMNRHLYGPKHGPALNVFDRQTKEWRMAEGFSQRARIVDGRLLVFTKISKSHLRNVSPSLMPYLHTFRALFCPHWHLLRDPKAVKDEQALLELS